MPAVTVIDQDFEALTSMLINLVQQLSVHHLLTPLTDLQRHALPVVSSNRQLCVIVHDELSLEDHFRHMVGKSERRLELFIAPEDY